MRLIITIDTQAIDHIRQLRNTGVETARRRMVEDAMRDTLAETMDRNPVDTGRSRSGWAAALGQLGGGGAIGTGGGEGSISRVDDGNVTDISATNTVDYIAFLEYGTSQRPPHSMARSALASTVQRLPALFHLD